MSTGDGGRRLIWHGVFLFAEEGIVNLALQSTAAAMLACCGLLLWGFRGRAA